MHFHGIDSPCVPNVPSRFVLAGTERKYERPRPFTLRHQLLDITLDVEHHSIDARATLDFVRVDSAASDLVLDAVGFELEAVRFVDGDQTSTASYTYDGDRISITIPSDLTQGCVEIDYRATPRRGLYFLGPDAKFPARPHEVWSQCQDEDARHWFPCHDAPHMKLTSELLVAVPKDWVALSNGTCIEQQFAVDDGKYSTFHFRLDQPHPSYLVTLVAGRFTILEDRPAELETGKRVPIRYYVPVGSEPDAWRGLADTPQMVEQFSRLTGLAYPFDSYAQVVVHDFIFGGMENTTATTLYEHVLIDERAALDVDVRSLVAHELAHQWFGDSLTCRDWAEAWLNEGFATFFEHIERELHLGRNDYDWSVLRALESYLGEFNESYDRPIVCHDYLAPIDLFDRHLYEKGSLILHMLRRKLGDAVFWSAIRSYVKSNSGGIVETRQLQRTCEETSGHALERFFDDWLYRSGHPELTVSACYEDGRLTVTLKQEPKGERTEPFSIDFEIRVMTADGEWLTLRRESQQLVESMVLSLPERPLTIAFDPELRVTAPVKLDLGFDWLEQLLRSDVSLRSRLLAASALGTRHDAPSLKLLAETLQDEDQPYMLRIECARALGKTRARETVSHLIAAVGARRAEVRRAVAAALGQFRAPEVVAPLCAMAATDSSYLVVAEACRSLGRSRQAEAKTTLLPMLEQSSWADVVRSGAIDGLAWLRDPELTPVLIEQTRYGVPSRGRRAAVLALGRIGTDRTVREELEHLLDDADPHLRADVVDALLALGQPEARSRLSAQLDRETDTRVQRRLREALRDLGTSDSGATKRLSDEVLALKTKLAELETQLSRLEPSREPKPSQGASKNRRGSKQRRAVPQAVQQLRQPKTRGAAPKATKDRQPKTRGAAAQLAKGRKPKGRQTR
jgi:aminopeptidase N